MYICVQKIAAVHEKAHFWPFLVEISLNFGKALKFRWNKYLERDKHCKLVRICTICMTINFCMTTPPVQNNSSAHSNTIGRFSVICTKCYKALQTKQQKCFEVLFCCCRTFPALIVINQAHFCLFVQRALWHFVQITENLPMILLTGAAIILNRWGGHTKVVCYANYAKCDVLAALIPFQVFILSAVQRFSKTEWYFYKKKPKMCFFVYRC